MKLFYSILFLAFVFNLNGQDDSVRVHKVLRGFIDNDFSDSIDYEHVDTVLSEFYYYQKNGHESLNSLGNPGLAFENMQFKSTDYGFSIGGIAFFGDASINKDRTAVYRTNIPFARVSYISGPKKYQDFDVFFTENISSRFNFSVAYNTFGSTGFYINQNTVGRKFDFRNSFKTKRDRYGYFMRFRVNSGTANENGGIKSDSLYNELTKLSPFDPENNKLKIQVWQESATNHYDDRSFSVSQFYRFGKVDSNGVSGNSLYLVLDNDGFTRDYWYDDAVIDSSYFDKFGLSVPDSTSVIDSYHNVGIRNKMFLKYQFANSGLQIRLGTNVNFYRNSNLYEDRDINESSVFGSFNELRLSEFVFSGFLEKGIQGFNSQGYLAKGDVTSYFVNNRLRGKLSAKFMSTLPTYKQLHYAGNILRWNNDFGYINSQEFILDLVMDSLGLYFNSSFEQLSNYVYYGENVAPKQYEKGFYTYRFVLSKKFSVKAFHFDIGVTYQDVEKEAPVNLANWIGKASAYYQRMLFKRAMEVRFGVDYWQYSRYTANRYAPFTRSFTYQNSYEVGNYPYLNFYISARIKGAQVFVNFQNIGQFAFRNNYMMVPDYPLQDFGMAFGLRWDFYN